MYLTYHVICCTREPNLLLLVLFGELTFGCAWHVWQGWIGLVNLPGLPHELIKQWWILQGPTPGKVIQSTSSEQNAGGPLAWSLAVQGTRSHPRGLSIPDMRTFTASGCCRVEEGSPTIAIFGQRRQAPGCNRRSWGVHVHYIQRPMRTNLSCCLGLIDNGQYKSTNRLLVLVPHDEISWHHENLGKSLHAVAEGPVNEGNQRHNGTYRR